jgi:hypothetical protein
MTTSEQVSQGANAVTGQAIARVLGDVCRVLDESENLYRRIEPFLVKQIVHQLIGSPDPPLSQSLPQDQHPSTQPFCLGEAEVLPSKRCSDSKCEPDTSCNVSAGPELLGESLG